MGSKPIDPVMPLSTTSAGCAAASTLARSPQTMRGLYPLMPVLRAAASRYSRNRCASCAVPLVATSSARTSTACCANNSREREPALRAATFSGASAASTMVPARRARCSITCIAWVPIDPVEPRRVTREGVRTRLLNVSVRAGDVASKRAEEPNFIVISIPYPRLEPEADYSRPSAAANPSIACESQRLRTDIPLAPQRESTPP